MLGLGLEENLRLPGPDGSGCPESPARGAEGGGLLRATSPATFSIAPG